MLDGERTDRILEWIAELKDSKTVLVAYHSNDPNASMSNNKVCPIEVKSSGYKTHKSLDEFMKRFSDRILWRYLVYTKDLGKDEDIICLPVYMVQFL